MSKRNVKLVSGDAASPPSLDALSTTDGKLMGQRAYEAIFSAIQSGRLKPGSRIREADLTEWLAMSRTPLHDALQRLENEGLLRLQSHRGVLISRLDRQAIAELYTAREWAEGAAAALAARNAMEADMATLRHILQLERAAADDPIAGARYNRKLHQTIYDCTRNRYLAAQLNSMAALLALAGDSTRRSPLRVAEAHREHTALVDAIGTGDAAAAEDCARRHIRAAQRFVLANHVENDSE
jgi:DNA-binding GntR family transcriptional regulator